MVILILVKTAKLTIYTKANFSIFAP